ncbi:hypothetical protein [Aureibacter tunicatorum]|uniref:Uncharacterized protein n=1 Tax=Aureibacter tunicatorum TaxID=866807 RepID=A0AAE3XI78_9BACT|nr:hypothetical protein [Aureibacter tunicatorum]MDR6238176.1 hypothetical protein [Aureibacter tunicatorum]BDD03209.1 hypothetical protein AUTU_06920 [Aureibacter tunicatorum]
MLDAPIGEGANTFIWIFLILVGFVKACVALDILGQKSPKSHD